MECVPSTGVKAAPGTNTAPASMPRCITSRVSTPTGRVAHRKKPPCGVMNSTAGSQCSRTASTSAAARSRYSPVTWRTWPCQSSCVTKAVESICEYVDAWM